MINKDVMIYSVQRTGSVFMWQCLQEIFTKIWRSTWDCMWTPTTSTDTTVRKPGVALDYSYPCIITERSDMDTFLSQWRTDNIQTEAFFNDWLEQAYGEDPPRPVHYPITNYSGWTHKNDPSQTLDMAKFKEACDSKTQSCYEDGQFKPGSLAIRSVREIMVSYREELAHLETFKQNYQGPILVLEYDQFVDNYDYIFSNFESFFEITISEETKTDIRENTTRSVNKIKQQALKGFEDYDPATRLRGGFIFTGNVGWSNEVLGEANLARMQTLLTCDFSEILTIDLGP